MCHHCDQVFVQSISWHSRYAEQDCHQVLIGSNGDEWEKATGRMINLALENLTDAEALQECVNIIFSRISSILYPLFPRDFSSALDFLFSDQKTMWEPSLIQLCLLQGLWKCRSLTCLQSLIHELEHYVRPDNCQSIVKQVYSVLLGCGFQEFVLKQMQRNCFDYGQVKQAIQDKLTGGNLILSGMHQPNINLNLFKPEVRQIWKQFWKQFYGQDFNSSSTLGANDYRESKSFGPVSKEQDLKRLFEELKKNQRKVEELENRFQEFIQEHGQNVGKDYNPNGQNQIDNQKLDLCLDWNGQNTRQSFNLVVEKWEEELISMKRELKEMTNQNQKDVEKNGESQEEMETSCNESVLLQNQLSFDINSGQKQLNNSLVSNFATDFQRYPVSNIKSNSDKEWPTLKWSTADEQDSLWVNKKTVNVKQRKHEKKTTKWSAIMDEVLWNKEKSTVYPKTRSSKNEKALQISKWSTASADNHDQQCENQLDEVEWPECLKWIKLENDDIGMRMMEEEDKAQEPKMPSCPPTKLISGRIHKSIRDDSASPGDQNSKIEQTKPETMTSCPGGGKILFTDSAKNITSSDIVELKSIGSRQFFCDRLMCDFCLNGFLSNELLNSIE